MANESIKINQSPVILAFRIILVLAISNAINLLIYIIISIFRTTLGDITYIFLYIVIISILALIVEIIIAIYAVLDWQNYYYIIQKDGIVINYGVFSRKSDDDIVGGLDEVTFSQKFFGRIFNFGDILVREPRSDLKTIMVNVPNPTQIVKIIKKRFINPENGG